MFNKSNLDRARRLVSRQRLHARESTSEFKSRCLYSKAYLDYLVCDDVGTMPAPDRTSYGVAPRTAAKIEKKLIRALSGDRRLCSTCKVELTHETASASVISRGGRCQACESRYYHERNGTEPTTKVPIPTRIWAGFRDYCLSSNLDPFEEAKFLLATAAANLPKGPITDQPKEVR